MKILYFITKSEEGGAQTHVAQLVRHFAAAGHEVAVMSYPGGWLEREIKKIGMNFLPNSYFANSLNPWRSLLAMREINRAVHDFKPDLVHCHSSVASFLARISVRRRIPTIFTSHGWGFNDYVSSWRRMLAIVAERLAAPYCDRIICVSDFTRDLAIKFKISAPEKISVVYNGMEPLQVKSKSAAVDGPVRIIFVGRLSEPKEPEILIESYVGLSDEIKKKSELIIVGDGPKRSMVEALVAKHGSGNIKLIGSLPREQMLREMAKADVFALSSKWESFGLTTLEAMSLGLPVIVSDVGGLREVVTEDVGIRVTRSNTVDMSMALDHLIRDKELRWRLGSAGRLRAQNEFGLKRMLDATEKIYSEVLAARSR